MLSFTQAVLLPTGGAVTVVEVAPDEEDGDEVQAASVTAVRAMANHDRTGFRWSTPKILADGRALRRYVAPVPSGDSQALAPPGRCLSVKPELSPGKRSLDTAEGWVAPH